MVVLSISKFLGDFEMAREFTFQNWLNESINYGFAKETFAKYIRALNKNLKIVYPEYDDLHRALSLLGLVDEPLDSSSVEEEKVVICFQMLRDLVENLKTKPSDFIALFGDEFSLSRSKIYRRTIEKRVYRCKTAFDQYARFLRGVSPEFAMQANYIRNHFRPHIRAAKSKKEKVLTLNYEHNRLKNLIDSDLNVYDALDNPKFMMEFGIAKIVQLRGEDRMRVTFF